MKSKKIYLAGPCDNENRTFMVRIGKYLRRQGFDVYCPFEYQVPDAWSMSQEAWAAKVFYADTDAIKNCDFFFMISKGRMSSAGTNWEQGFAKGIGKTVFVFQITDNSTSLMTFCGSDYFYNTNEEDIINTLYEVTTMLFEDDWKEYFALRSKICKTILT